jgi:hypothetical protein
MKTYEQIIDELHDIKRYEAKIPDNQLGMPDHLEGVAHKIQGVIDSLVTMKKATKKAAKGWRGYNSNNSSNSNKTVPNNNVLRTTRKKPRHNNRN